MTKNTASGLVASWQHISHLKRVHHSLFQSENRILLSKLINKYPLEIDATTLQKILRGHWKAYLVTLLYKTSTLLVMIPANSLTLKH